MPERPDPRLLVWLLVLWAATPGTAMAQSVPKAELGIQLSAQTGDHDAIAWSPRLTLNVTPLSAIEATADVRVPSTDTFGAHRTRISGGLHLRQALLASDRWALFGIVGAGVDQRTFSLPEATYGPPGQSVTLPAQRFNSTSVVAYLGQSVQVDVARRLSLRADARLSLGDSGGLRALAGGMVPIGSLPVATSRRQALRERDSLANGLKIGALSGAVTAGALFGAMGWVLCESEPCDAFALKTSAFGVASGAITGGLLGALIDSLFKNR